MRICLLSDYSGKLDEGMRNVAYHYAARLAVRHQVLHLCLKPFINLLKPDFWSGIKKFKPDIIHFIPGSTFNTFILTETLKASYPKAKIVMSALHPVLTPLSQRLVSIFHPDMILTQSDEAEQMFTRLGCQTRFLINGVDIEKFTPVSAEMKRELRKKYNLDGSCFILLHVGHLQHGRNLQALQPLQKSGDARVLIVGSVSVGSTERAIYRKLVDAGCLVWNRYFQDIQEIYGLSDCYIFPTFNRRNCVEFPLSIMEAMACNLPVITTRFGSIPQIFEAGQGLHYASGEADFIPLAEKIRGDTNRPSTREKVLPFSWQNIVNKLEAIYSEVLDGPRS